MDFIKRINLFGWLMLAIEALFGLRYVIPGLNLLTGNPPREFEFFVVIMSAFAFGVFGLKRKS